MGVNPNAFVNRLFNLEHHVGVITGASRSIGQGAAEVLLKAGATIYNFDVNQPEDAMAMTTIQVDITDRVALDQAVAEVVRREGKLDFLINNAGITHKQRAEEFDMERYKKIQDINLVRSQSCNFG